MDLSRRAFIATSTTAALAAGQTAASAEEVATPSTGELQDPQFASAAQRDIASDVIHIGNQAGHSVTPIYPGKNSNGYQRPSRTPTITSLEAKLIALEGGAAAANGPCGMGVITQCHLGLLKTGDHIVTHRCNYWWVMDSFTEFLPKFGITVAFVNLNDPDELRTALSEKRTRLVHFEPYVNPTMEVLPALDLLKIAKEAGVTTLVDNTWLTPYLFQPLRRGADLVAHSATKFIGGHGSAMGGLVVGGKDIINQVRHVDNVLGGLLRPFDAFLLDQGLKTLPMRVERHSHSAQAVAEWLADHPRVKQVRYGGLDSWRKLQTGPEYVNGYAGMLGVEWADDAALHFGRHLQMAKPWTSLGDVVTLVTNYRAMPERGIPPRYTRVSIGLEDPADIISDFQQALEKSA